MTKKDFIALAEPFANTKRRIGPFYQVPFNTSQIEALSDFCQRQNSAFSRDRWLAYIAGECGPNGGTVKGGR